MTKLLAAFLLLHTAIATTPSRELPVKRNSICISLVSPTASRRKSCRDVNYVSCGGTATGEGCIDDSGKVLKFGEQYRKGNFIFKCERVNSTMVTLTPIKCILDEREMTVEETRRKDGFAYACQRTGDGISLSMVGCFGDGNDFVKFGETFTKNNFTFMCAIEGDYGFHRALGCIIQGRHVKVNETFPVGTYLYKCSIFGNGNVQTEVVGCINGTGRHFRVGERYRDGSFVYLCKKVESSTRAVLAGCIAKVAGEYREFTFGESWITDSNTTLSHKMKCTGNETMALTEITHCVANLNGAKYLILVGKSVPLSNNKFFACRGQKNGNVIGEIVPQTAPCKSREKSESRWNIC